MKIFLRRLINFLKKPVLILALSFLLFTNWVIYVFHVGTVPEPKIPNAAVPTSATAMAPATERAEISWIPKEKSVAGIHQLILTGSPYERGLLAGQKTADLLRRQENELLTQLHAFIPQLWILKALEVVAIPWFWGLDKYLEPWMTLEMLGVSKSAPLEHNDLGDPFLRQIAYHGIHEVGQLMVDQGSDAMGCTVVALPFKNAWVIGRNFDFEGGRIFDSEKIMKWVFPNEGNAFVSIIWAGMVGVVTGVNERGLYISINAAGSNDFKRIGTPSTLVLLKALQFANNAKEAIEIFKKADMFITDIFVVSDRNNRTLYRVEKSPLHTEVIELSAPSVVANHLAADRWQNDSVNIFRKNELTSAKRQSRGEVLIDALARSQPPTSRAAAEGVLKILRDKGVENNAPLNFGNRQAIDSLIATHSVVYDEIANILYVGQGPAVAGPFVGFDLNTSFRLRQPQRVDELARDPLLSNEYFEQIKLSLKKVSQATRATKHRDCAQAHALLAQAQSLYSETPEFYAALGDTLARCDGHFDLALKARRQALKLHPAYARQRRELETKIKEQSQQP